MIFPTLYSGKKNHSIFHYIISIKIFCKAHSLTFKVAFHIIIFSRFHFSIDFQTTWTLEIMKKNCVFFLDNEPKNKSKSKIEKKLLETRNPIFLKEIRAKK